MPGENGQDPDPGEDQRTLEERLEEGDIDAVQIHMLTVERLGEIDTTLKLICDALVGIRDGVEQIANAP